MSDESFIRSFSIEVRRSSKSVGVGRVDAAEDHRLDLLVARAAGRRRPGGRGDRCPHLGVVHVLRAGDQVAHVAGRAARLSGRVFISRTPTSSASKVFPLSKNFTGLALAERPVHDPDVDDGPPIGIEHRVEDQRAAAGRRGLPREAGTRATTASRISSIAEVRLGARQDDVIVRAPDQVLDLVPDRVDHRAREVDLVDDRDDLQPGVDGKIQVADGLRLDPLRGVDDEDGTLARGERAGDFVGEIDVPGGVDEVEDVLSLDLRACSASGWRAA